MLLFELLTGQRPFESLSTTQELNRAVIQGERPVVSDGNADHAFPSMMDLMYDCWKHTSSERPNADEVCLCLSVCLSVRLNMYLHYLIFSFLPSVSTSFIRTRIYVPQAHTTQVKGPPLAED